MARKLKFGLAINEALKQAMQADERVILIGQGVKSPWYVGNTCKDLIELFGDDRVIDTPVSENAMTGAAVGAAIAGHPAISVHPRVDFMLYAFDPIINQAANWSYMNGGALPVPVVFWGIINRGGEQAAQHSQALQAMFAHVPGLKVVMPATARDAKGLMVAAIKDPNPVVFIDDRWLYGIEDEVPEEIFETPIGKAHIAREGTDLTIVASSYLVQESLKAAQILQNTYAINAEVIDLRSIKPLDSSTILASARKTKKIIVVDGTWASFGVAAEILAQVLEHAPSTRARRLALPDLPAPANRVLEKDYYIHADNIVDCIKNFD
ncbi:MAG: hypothetical protein A2504_11860 [Bdellovibrionales bacterium RIFOXYD12_FULL_39_22]|nr:MAG: hypothetical protein A2385_16375 [Bdellovibrionales bacterium RIFOXYB1_FULL_39_21]OFZ44467.1 MAG: hypothetical protein A2485_06520 [Bdellovibrionales bacterium RIFOXYC12_FULL_39_17]OFZ49891.1 MAG: hypothetical protein A2404_00945 [Bdellovibrionales bacterium RIFOXYC1_FULL_39_130]OFZ76896.1 MAG: hypothetical protein A2560_05745 [Bdellovibrionales bacterium RIFOXYD1_FULL_39_84]OFZ95823.1 MAG: hypothetical protein A2504_11860 [Bdellovibrionales bacterium RIFOXYD12_FULL_39_22]HLE10843.1 tr